jgi:hypothetical protein
MFLASRRKAAPAAFGLPNKPPKQKVRAQPIGISAAPNMAGQARGEGGKDGRSALPKRDAYVCSLHRPLCRNGIAPSGSDEEANLLLITNM